MAACCELPSVPCRYHGTRRRASLPLGAAELRRQRARTCPARAGGHPLLLGHLCTAAAARRAGAFFFLEEGTHSSSWRGCGSAGKQRVWSGKGWAPLLLAAAGSGGRAQQAPQQPALRSAAVDGLAVAAGQRAAQVAATAAIGSTLPTAALCACSPPRRPPGRPPSPAPCARVRACAASAWGWGGGGWRRRRRRRSTCANGGAGGTHAAAGR